MKRFILLGLMMMVIVNTFAQTNVDSLVNVLETQELPAGEKILLYRRISRFFLEDDIRKGINYSKEGLSLSKKEKDGVMISTFSNYLGIAFTYMAIYDSARIYLDQSLERAIESDDKDREQVAYSNLGNLYFTQGKYSTALEYYIKCLNMDDSPNNATINLYTNIGVIHTTLRNWERAIEYLEKALKIAESLDLDGSKMTVLYNLGAVYSKKGEHDKALEYLMSTLELSQKLHNKHWENETLLVIASTFFLKEDYEQALYFINKCLPLLEEFGNPQLFLGYYIVLSDIYRKQHRYKESEVLSVKAWKLDSISFDNGLHTASNLAIAYIYLGNNDKAEYFLRKGIDILIENNTKSLHNSLADMEVKYETEKKEIRIASLEKERQLYVWLGIAGGVIAIALAIVLLQHKRNARKEKQLIATRSILDGEMKERTRLAQDLHDRLSGNLSAVKIELGKHSETLQNVRDQLDKCIRDIRDAAHNLMPASLQYGMKVALEDFAAKFPNVRFHFFGKEKRIGERMEYVIYCCANELVNNAVRHSGADIINLQLVQDEAYVTLTVSDDGCGFDEKTVTKGLGLKSIRNRVASCNGKIDIVASSGKGTETTIELKVEN